MNRRSFLKVSAAPAFVSLSARVASAQGPPAAMRDPRAVLFVLDGILLSAADQTALLAKLGAAGKAEPDFYARGGVVSELEKAMASLLGKERAIFLPTGTMANRLALQVLAGDRRRVLVSRECHTYNDEGDGPQHLSGLSLIPLAPGRATFTVDDVKSELQRFEGGAPAVPPGAIALECPVRRRSGQLFDHAAMKQIAAHARERRYGLHLDGARLQLASAYSGVSPAEYASLVDTVYVSLYKYLNAPGGAVLAGSQEVIEQVARLRHVSGGGIHAAWPQAAIALHYLDGFAGRFAEAVRRGEALFRLLAREKRLRLERVPQGTNIVFLHVGASAQAVDAWTRRLGDERIFVARAGEKKVQLNVNETILRRSPEELATTFRETLARAVAT
jgi:threonine aldolase